MPVIAIMNLTLFSCFFVSLFLCVFQLCDNTFEFSTLIREMQTVTTSTASDPSYTLALDVPNTAATWIDYDVTAKTWIVISARVINKDDPTPTADLPKLPLVLEYRASPLPDHLRMKASYKYFQFVKSL